MKAGDGKARRSRESSRARLTLRPGDPGTLKHLEEYGDRLVAVRYRYDEELMKRLTTVELIVEERAWVPERRMTDPDRLVGLKIGWGEKAVWRRVQEAGGEWDSERRIWWIQHYRAAQFGLEERITNWSQPRLGKISNTR